MFHQKQTIRQCLTNSPKTPCGQELKDIANHLKDYDTDSLLARLNELKRQYKEILKERNEDGRFMHRRVRRTALDPTGVSPWREFPLNLYYN